MNLSNINWNKDYASFIKYLYTLQDIKYREFHSKLLVECDNLIGIRIPNLKNIAKDIAKGDYKSFIKNNLHSTYEEIMIHGLVLGYSKIPFNALLDEIDIFIPYDTNWAINDTVCANLKVFKKNQEEGYQYIKKLINSEKNWYIRFGLVLLLDHYINDMYIDDILDICNNIKNDDYYVKMANAWLISFCFIKYEEKTYKLLLNNNIDNFTYNKAISKICDSYRVDEKTKNSLKRIRK